MKKIFSIFFIICLNYVHAQTKQNYTWITGSGNSFVIKLDSNQFKFTDYFDTTFVGMYRMGHGFSNICDSSGNIKLISNGCNILSPNKNIFDGCDSIG